MFWYSCPKKAHLNLRLASAQDKKRTTLDLRIIKNSFPILSRSFVTVSNQMVGFGNRSVFRLRPFILEEDLAGEAKGK